MMAAARRLRRRLLRRPRGAQLVHDVADARRDGVVGAERIELDRDHIRHVGQQLLLQLLHTRGRVERGQQPLELRQCRGVAPGQATSPAHSTNQIVQVSVRHSEWSSVEPHVNG